MLAAPAHAEGPPAAAAAELYDRPVLVVDPGMHTNAINSTDADAQDRWAVTGSSDKTVRVWSLQDGLLLRTIRLPAGPGTIGSVYAVAISPDGALIAAGGDTAGEGAPQQIYLFDRDSGVMIQRIQGLPDNVNHLAFSPDGSLLAATLAGGFGVRVYARGRDWGEIARDTHDFAESSGASFAPHGGRLAITTDDGHVRLYTGALAGELHPSAVVAVPSISSPYGIAFSPDGARLAVGDDESAAVALLDGHTLHALPGPDLGGVANGDLAAVAWSRDGTTLLAGGNFKAGDGYPVLAWGDAGSARPRMLPAGRETMMHLVPLLGGDLLAAAADPWLARLQTDGGSAGWAHGSPNADFEGQSRTLSVSADGAVVDFGFTRGGADPARFDFGTRTLSLNPPHDGRTAAPRQAGLPVGGWDYTRRPTLSGRPLPLEPYEYSHSLAVDPSGDRFVLGTEWAVRAYRADGTPLWSRLTSADAWAVNITGDGRLVVAAYGDGTIRWYRMSDGVELLALKPLPDQANWVGWTPEGVYDATAGAHGILSWHVNRGWDHAADSIPVEDIPGSLRPSVLPLVLQELETARALGLAALAEIKQQVVLRTHSQVPPGARLHLLAIGISTYNPAYAEGLRLHYADRDAHDLASAIVNTQGSLYAQVLPQELLNEDASKLGILRALDTMRMNMERSGGQDLAVVHFAGHGALVGDKLYLLPYDVHPDAFGIRTGALSVEELRDNLQELGRHGRVLVLLDACQSGAITAAGTGLAMNSSALRAGLAAPNVTVLTSSTGSQPSREDAAWGHGAFTKALLDAFDDPAADIDHDGLISMNGLAHYVAQRVPVLTGGAQTPDMEVRYEGTVFASTH